MVKMYDPVQKKIISFHVSSFMKRGLDGVKKAINTKDQDRVWIVDGPEGSGKSTICMQMCKYVDPSFCLDDVCMDHEELAKAIRSVKPHTGKAKLFDEGFKGLSSRGAMSKKNRDLIELIMEARQKNIFLVIAIPYIFMLDTYAALARSKVLIHVHVSKKKKIHMFYGFDYIFKKKLILEGKKTMSYAQTIKKMPIKCRGKFYGNYVIDEKSYRDKKAVASNRIVLDVEDNGIIERNNLILLTAEELKIKAPKLKKLFKIYGFDISEQHINRILTKLRKQKEVKKDE